MNNNFVKNANYYETSILDEVLDKNYNNVNSKKDIENYKNKLLSNYWTEINLIGYKIELLKKQKVECTEELKSRIVYIGNEIGK